MRIAPGAYPLNLVKSDPANGRIYAEPVHDDQGLGVPTRRFPSDESGSANTEDQARGSYHFRRQIRISPGFEVLCKFYKAERGKGNHNGHHRINKSIFFMSNERMGGENNECHPT